MACEYVTRAYNILYKIQHGAEFDKSFIFDIENGSPYIEQVYNMILKLEE